MRRWAIAAAVLAAIAAVILVCVVIDVKTGVLGGLVLSLLGLTAGAGRRKRGPEALPFVRYKEAELDAQERATLRAQAASETARVARAEVGRDVATTAAGVDRAGNARRVSRFFGFGGKGTPPSL